MVVASQQVMLTTAEEEQRVFPMRSMLRDYTWKSNGWETALSSL
jgi:hypothetical protein